MPIAEESTVVQTSSFAAGNVLVWKGRQNPSGHQAELARLARRGEGAWIQLPAALLATRYGLKAIEQSFDDTETASAIQTSLRQLQTFLTTEWHQHHLIAQPHADAPCYNISTYVAKCIAGDLGIAERLRGRTVVTLYQTEEPVADLLSDTGVIQFVDSVLKGYLETYGKRNLIGFSCELPSFLSLASVLENETVSIPWSPTLLETLDETVVGCLPLVFHETYNSAAIRNTFWGELTKQFATCFLGRLRNFCHSERLQFALSLPGSAKALTFELGTTLAQVDCPILNVTEIDTPKRFVVAKWICSNTQLAGISRKHSQRTDEQTLAVDASLGFNLWINRSRNKSERTRAAE